MKENIKVYSIIFLIGGLLVGIILGIISTLLISKNSQTIFPPAISPTSAMYQSCTYKNHKYKDGEGFMDDCNSCSCQNGQVSCTLIACNSDDKPTETTTIE